MKKLLLMIPLLAACQHNNIIDDLNAKIEALTVDKEYLCAFAGEAQVNKELGEGKVLYVGDHTFFFVEINQQHKLDDFDEVCDDDLHKYKMIVESRKGELDDTSSSTDAE